MLLSRISAISPGGEQQEIAGYQASRHDHRGKLLELFNGHPCIVMLSSAESSFRSRMVKLAH